MVTQEGEDLTHKIQNQELTVDEYKNMEEEIQSLIPALGHVKAQRQEKNQAFKKTEERINELTKQVTTKLISIYLSFLNRFKAWWTTSTR